MDKNSKMVLNYLIKNGGCEKAVFFSSDLDDMAEDLQVDSEDLRANVRFLHEIGYIDYQKFSGTDRNAAFALSHKGLHWKYFRRQEIIRYLEDKWIDLFAMLLSLISLILSVIAIRG